MFSLMSLCDEILCRERNDSTNAVKGLLSLATSRYCGRQQERVITHASHVCSQHSFGLRMNGMHRPQFDPAR